MTRSYNWLAIPIICLVGFLAYQQFQQQKVKNILLEKLKREVNHVEDKKAVACPADVPVSQERPIAYRWSELQPRVRDTVVQVFTQIADYNWIEPYKTPNQFGATGSGFFINDSGDLITNWHVVNQACAVSIQIPSMGKRRFDVKIVGVNPDRDLALLRLLPEERQVVVDALGSIPYLELGDSDRVRRSDEIMTLGYPLGQQMLKSTTGVVSGRENIDGQYMIQISAPINPGSSGGASINQNAQVVGINTAGFQAAQAQNVNYIIPSNELKLFLEQLSHMDDTPDQEIKFLRKPFLGVLYNNSTESLAKFLGNPLPGGLYVVEAYRGSPLYKAGVLAGDMIYEIDGHRLDSFGEMQAPWCEDRVSIVNYVSRTMVGEKIHLKIYRKGKEIDLVFPFIHSDPAPIRRIFPCYEKVDYEMIGGMVIMPLALNHVPHLIQSSPELAKYAELKNQLEPVLIITHILPDSSAFRCRALGPGALLSEVNGVSVKTLHDFSKAVQDSIKSGFLTIKTTENVFVVLPMDRILSEEKRLSQLFHYDITPLMRGLLDKKG